MSKEINPSFSLSLFRFFHIISLSLQKKLNNLFA